MNTMLYKGLSVFACAFMIACMASCYDDKGNYDYRELPAVEVSLPETVYATQFTRLQLPAALEFANGAAEGDFTYSWRIWSNEALGTHNQKKDICLTKDLDYEVVENTGSYRLMLTCHNMKTNVDYYKETDLIVQGVITEGWMVLHEKDGVTDFDLLMSPYFPERAAEDKRIRNVFSSINGENLRGRGVEIHSFWSLGRYQDVVVLTDEGGARLDASSMQIKFDIETLLGNMPVYRPQRYVFYDFYWGPGRFCYEGLISDGKYYIYNTIDGGYSRYTEPICRDGLTYEASPHYPRRFANYNCIIYDEEHQKFICAQRNGDWTLKDMPATLFTNGVFSESDIKGTLRWMELGFNDWEYGLFQDRETKENTLLAFDFNQGKADKGIYSAAGCPGINEAQYFAVGTLGPIFYYATRHDIYQWDYASTGTSRKLHTVGSGSEEITGMYLYKPTVDRFITAHPFNARILILSTYDASSGEGKVYMYNVNVSNGMIDTASEKVFGGFGEILSMAYNYPKYGF